MLSWGESSTAGKKGYQGPWYNYCYPYRYIIYQLTWYAYCYLKYRSRCYPYWYIGYHHVWYSYWYLIYLFVGYLKYHYVSYLKYHYVWNLKYRRLRYVDCYSKYQVCDILNINKHIRGSDIKRATSGRWVGDERAMSGRWVGDEQALSGRSAGDHHFSHAFSSPSRAASPDRGTAGIGSV